MISILSSLSLSSSIITVDEIYTQNLNKLVCEFFETDSIEHPGVRKILSSGDYFVSGKIELIIKYLLSLSTKLNSEYNSLSSGTL